MGENRPIVGRLTAHEDTRLRALIRQMSRKSAIYELLKEELGALGHWKARPRGKPDAKYLRLSGQQRRANIHLGDDN